MSYKTLNLYKRSESIHLDAIQAHHANSHTMARSIGAYVAQRIPTIEIKKVVGSQGTVEMYGVYPEDIKGMAKELGLKDLKRIKFKIHSSKKKYNHIRPEFFTGTRLGRIVLAIFVPPGRDYLVHYGSMVKYFLLDSKMYDSNSLRVVCYPKAEELIPTCTKLGRRFVKKGDRVVIGYVEQIRSAIKKSSDWELIETHSNLYYECYRYKTSQGKIVNLLGVKYSFWGSISYHLTQQLCQLGATEVIYFGKLGTLTSPKDIYTKIFAPSKFVLLNAQKTTLLHGVLNNIVSQIPALDSGTHLTVPTVLEQGYILRKLGRKLGVSTIDDEISYIAKAIRDHNRKHKDHTKLGVIHIATDYLRNNNEKRLVTRYDLSNHRTKSAKTKKDAAIKKAANYLIQYLSR